MRHLFLLFLFLLAPIVPLHSTQEPPDAFATETLRSRAEQGDAEAQFWLGLRYQTGGGGVRQDYVEAHKWYLKAAEQGHAAAQSQVGYLYFVGGGVAQDYVKAREWYLKAAEQGHAYSQYRLGSLYANAWADTTDQVKARNWWLRAAEQGSALAQLKLGDLYVGGRGVAQDYAMARKWWVKAAEQGDADAQTRLGAVYEFGDRVTQDYAMAYVWYNIAAAQDHTTAKKSLEIVAAKLDPVSLAEAQKLSTEYFKRYVEPFHPLHSAQEQLDSPSCIDHFRSLAEQGDAEAQYRLSMCYFADYSYVEARDWSLKAAVQGHYLAQWLLGSLYEDGGHGVAKDYVDARTLWDTDTQVGGVD